MNFLFTTMLGTPTQPPVKRVSEIISPQQKQLLLPLNAQVKTAFKLTLIFLYINMTWNMVTEMEYYF
jgi:hypothetical protein